MVKITGSPASKSLLSGYGLVVPVGEVGTAKEAAAIAQRIGFPVAVKAAGERFAHKTELGAVRLGLNDRREVAEAIASIEAALGARGETVERFLVEQMVCGAVAELIVGVKRDAQFGPALIVGAGGILVELVSDYSIVIEKHSL